MITAARELELELEALSQPRSTAGSTRPIPGNASPACPACQAAGGQELSRRAQQAGHEPGRCHVPGCRIDHSPVR
jgi:putative hemolysin